LAQDNPVAAIAAGALANAARQLRSDPAAAAALARDALKLEPQNLDAALVLAKALGAQGRFHEAIEILKPFAAPDAADPRILVELGGVLGRIGDMDRAAASYFRVLRRQPELVKVWLVYGHALKALGLRDAALGAYREAIRQQPSFGEAYWSIADLKTVRYSDDEIAAMRAQAALPGLEAQNRVHFEFALGKAMEDAADFAGAFAHVARANALHRDAHPYDHVRTEAFFARLKAVMTPALFAGREGCGAPAQDPIFVVGMMRSGSTLVEQILASHSLVEGTGELHHIAQIAHGLGSWENSQTGRSYPEALAALEPQALKALGEQYLSRARQHRRLGRARFVDKMPNNFLHVGLIHLILPNAKIVDVRRDVRACGWSCFAQHFAGGMPYLYDLDDIRRYYEDYVALMAHVDRVLPGLVHRVQYEDLVAEPERRIREMLEHCGLPFEPGCLDFHRTARAIHTPSSEQVRRPIFREGLEKWRSFEPWLGALGGDGGMRP